MLLLLCSDDVQVRTFPPKARLRDHATLHRVLRNFVMILCYHSTISVSYLSRYYVLDKTRSKYISLVISKSQLCPCDPFSPLELIVSGLRDATDTYSLRLATSRLRHVTKGTSTLQYTDIFRESSEVAQRGIQRESLVNWLEARSKRKLICSVKIYILNLKKRDIIRAGDKLAASNQPKLKIDQNT